MTQKMNEAPHRLIIVRDKKRRNFPASRLYCAKTFPTTIRYPIPTKPPSTSPPPGPVNYYEVRQITACSVIFQKSRVSKIF